MVIADGHLMFLWGLCGYALLNILTLSPQREWKDGKTENNSRTELKIVRKRAYIKEGGGKNEGKKMCLITHPVG